MSIVLWSEAMRRKRRNHSSEFKAKVALAAIQEDLTMVELVKKFDVHANQISDWKKQLLSGAPDVFGKGDRKAEDAEQTVHALQAKVGQLTRACPMRFYVKRQVIMPFFPDTQFGLSSVKMPT
jgi:transposase